MKCNPHCAACLLKKQQQFLAGLHAPQEKKQAYLHAVTEMINRYSSEESSPRLLARIAVLQKEYLDYIEDMSAEKRLFNDILLQKEALFQNEIDSADDPLAAALRLSRAGNYIDLSAVENVTDEKLFALLREAKDSVLDEKTLHAFRQDLLHAKKLTFCTDNCGEVVLDKLLIKTIQKLYPDLQITVMVRGENVINDATMEDAEQINLTGIAPVIGNGTAIPGTDPDALSGKAKEAFESADLIISKGQGNFESLSGCGYNIYYLFLCKCDHFVQMFGLKQFEGVFARERSLFPGNNA